MKSTARLGICWIPIRTRLLGQLISRDAPRNSRQLGLSERDGFGRPACGAIFFTASKVIPCTFRVAFARFHPQFSSDFHREVLWSTVSAQGGNLFLLRRATFRTRVGSANTWHSQILPTDDCGDASGRLAI